VILFRAERIRQNCPKILAQMGYNNWTPESAVMSLRSPAMTARRDSARRDASKHEVTLLNAKSPTKSTTVCPFCRSHVKRTATSKHLLSVECQLRAHDREQKLLQAARAESDASECDTEPRTKNRRKQWPSQSATAYADLAKDLPSSRTAPALAKDLPSSSTCHQKASALRGDATVSQPLSLMSLISSDCNTSLPKSQLSLPLFGWKFQSVFRLGASLN